MAKRKTKATTKPLLLTQEIVDEAAAIVRMGNFRYVARGRLGISEGTWKSWLSRGRLDLRESENGESEMSLQAKFVVALDRAENEALSEIIRDVMLLGSDPASVKIKLEYAYRRHGKLFSRTASGIDDETGETVRVDPLELLAEKLKPFID